MNEQLKKNVEKEFRRVYQTAIKNFYDDYTPIKYKRQFRSYDGVNISFSQPKEGNGFHIAMHVNDRYINNKYKNANTQWVFNNTFSLGYHGIIGIKNVKRDNKKKGLSIKTIKTTSVRNVKQMSSFPIGFEIGRMGKNEFVPKEFMDNWFNYFVGREVKPTKNEKKYSKYFRGRPTLKDLTDKIIKKNLKSAKKKLNI